MASSSAATAASADDGWLDVAQSQDHASPVTAAVTTPLNHRLMQQLFPNKDANKREDWLQALRSQEFDTLEELATLDATGWDSLPLPLAVRSGIRQAATADPLAQHTTPSVVSGAAAPPPRLITQVDLVVLDISMSMRSKSELDPAEAQEYYERLDDGTEQKYTMTTSKSNRRTREDISKLLFHTLVDKALVFELSHAIGLVAFGESVDQIGVLTTAYETFHDELGRLDANQGRTRLYDSIQTASDIIERYCAANGDNLAENVDKRIFVLTDGQDNASRIQPWELSRNLQTSGIKLDAIPLGGMNSILNAICTAAGGLCFNCVDQQQAIGLFESEATLQISRREQPSTEAPVINDSTSFQRLSSSLAQQDGGGATTEVRSAVSKSVMAQTVAPEAALAMMAAKQQQQEQQQSGGGGCMRRAMKEYGSLLKNPPEGWQVFVGEDHPLSWKAVLSRGEPSAEWLQQVGPCPYANGTWLLSVDIPADYPFSPPKIRFVTPVFHCNVSVDGMICLAMLQDSWSPALTITKALEAVRTLLLSPDAINPLDAWKGQLFRDDQSLYVAEATKHTQEHAYEGFDVLASRYKLGPSTHTAAA